MLLKPAVNANIHVTVETTAHIPSRQIPRSDAHGRFRLYRYQAHGFAGAPRKTGVNNELILRNIETLVNAKWPGRLVCVFR
jgi:hypothetical protein